MKAKLPTIVINDFNDYQKWNKKNIIRRRSTIAPSSPGKLVKLLSKVE